MNSSVVLGIAGTAKNTGKTTALNALLVEAHARSVPAAVTSIGYDGESIDNVTGLPKPRIVLHEGTIATTSVACVPRTGYEVVEETEWSTALGRILIVRCVEAGSIVLAGPGTRRELSAVVERMREFGPSIMLIDGALNRLAPMSVSSALLLSTGAARSAGLADLARDTASIESILDLPVFTPSAETPAIRLSIPFASVADLQKVVADQGYKKAFLRVQVPVSAATLRSLVRVDPARSIIRHVQFTDPVVALLSAEPSEMAEILEEGRLRGLTVSVERPLPLACITVNPFVPRYDGHRYVADRVPADALKNAVAEAVRMPVVDVVRDGSAMLWNTLNDALKNHHGL